MIDARDVTHFELVINCLEAELKATEERRAEIVTVLGALRKRIPGAEATVGWFPEDQRYPRNPHVPIPGT